MRTQSSQIGTHIHTHSHTFTCTQVPKCSSRQYDCIPTRGYYNKRKSYCICLCVYIKASSVYLLEYSYDQLSLVLGDKGFMIQLCVFSE